MIPKSKDVTRAKQNIESLNFRMDPEDVETLTKNTKVVTVSNSTHCTPLALDEMKRRNIKIEREIK